MPQDTVIEESNAIIGLYLLFSRLLNEEMSPELRDILLQPDVLEVFVKADPAVAEYLQNQDFDYEQAAVDFCDTFILPNVSVQPRAAAWLSEGDPVSPDGIHSVVDAFLTTLSLTLPDNYAKLPFDHASVLFYLAAVLREKGSDQAAEFESATLGAWVAPFAKGLTRSGKCPLYRSLGTVLAAA